MRLRQVAVGAAALGSAIIVSVGFLAGLVGVAAYLYGVGVSSDLFDGVWDLGLPAAAGLGAPALYAGSWRARSRTARMLYGVAGVFLAVTAAAFCYSMSG